MSKTTHLQDFRRLSTVASTVPENGDLNPYAVFIAPVSSGVIEKGDVIVDNFNNGSNLRGAGGTIVLVNLETRAVRLFAKLPRNPGSGDLFGLALSPGRRHLLCRG